MRETKYTTTENGARSLATSQPDELKEQVNGRVSLFFKTTRDLLKNVPQLQLYLTEAWSENPLDVLKLVFHLRDCRGGKGERDLFRACCRWLLDSGKEEFLHCNLELVPEFGRWDDLMFCGPKGYEVLAERLVEDFFIVQHWLNRDSTEEKDVPTKRPTISMASKWACRLPKGSDSVTKKKKRISETHSTIKAINQYLKRTNKAKFTNESDQRKIFGRTVIREAEYRKMLGSCSRHLELLELLMCEQRFGDIDFNTVPSCAMHLYGKNHIKGGKAGSFLRNQQERFTQWRDGLEKGVDSEGKKVKVNASQLYVHSLVAEYQTHAKPLDKVVEAQWKELVRLSREKGEFSALCCPDVSGSMTMNLIESKIRPMDVAIALGIFCSELSTGPFHNMLITFSSNPVAHHLNDSMSLYDKVKSVSLMDWGGSTNIQGVWNLILNTAVHHRVEAKDMPKMIIIPSDMQWNVGARENSDTNHEVMKRKYQEAGYELPVVVYWNLSGSTQKQNDYPVSALENGTVLLSGFSTSLLKNLIECPRDVTPWRVIQNTVLNAERYSRVCLPGGVV